MHVKVLGQLERVSLLDREMKVKSKPQDDLESLVKSLYVLRDAGLHVYLRGLHSVTGWTSLRYEELESDWAKLIETQETLGKWMGLLGEGKRDELYEAIDREMCGCITDISDEF